MRLSLRALRFAAPLLAAFLLAPTAAHAQTPASAARPAGRVLDEIVALVGTRPVLRSEVDALSQRSLGSPTAEVPDGLWWNVLQQIVDQYVLSATAQRDSTILVGDAEVEAAVENRLDQLGQQVGGRDRVAAAFGRTESALRAELRTQLRDQIQADRLRRRHGTSVRVTPSEVRTWFTQIPADSLPVIPTTVRVAHIVRRLDPTEAATAQARQAIQALRDSVTSGQASFEDLAARYSDDPGSARQGGSLGMQPLDLYVPEFRAVAATAPVGQVSAPFRTQFGYHILRVNRRVAQTADVSHILLRVSSLGVDPAPVVGYLNAVRDSALAGTAFERLARTHSQDSSSAVFGGRVVDPNSGQRDLVLAALGPQWTPVLDTMEVGDVSRPAPVDQFDGSPAYHIVLLQRRTPEHRVSLDTDYAEIAAQALRDKQARELATYARGLRREVYVEYRGKARELASRFGS